MPALINALFVQRSIANTGCANVTCLRLTAKCKGFIQIQSSPAQNVTNVMLATPGSLPLSSFRGTEVVLLCLERVHELPGVIFKEKAIQ